MVMLRMVVLSLMAGLVAAGFVWFGFDLARNLRVVAARLSAKRKQPPAAAPQGEEKKPADDKSGKAAEARKPEKKGRPS